MNMTVSYMIEVISELSEAIGARGSCTPNERQAGEAMASRLQDLGLVDIRTETFQAIPSTYWPYGLAFALALTGSLSCLLFGGLGAFTLAAVFNAMGFWGMLAETDLNSNWTHWFLPLAHSQNVSCVIQPKIKTHSKAVICAHLDTHRTPIFYSSNTWQVAFTILIGLTLISMGMGAVGYSLGASFGWSWARWLGLVLIPVQGFALFMCLQADFTPYSPGANDNASGAAVMIEVVNRLKESPLDNTQVHLVFTGCEEVGDQGMQAFLESHGDELGRDAFYLIIDQVGAGRIKYLSSDGLLIKHKTHPQALKVAREAIKRCPHLETFESPGLAYTDALKATKLGLIALTLCAVPRKGEAAGANWHQMSDTLEHIRPEDLERVFQFTWEILKILDEASA
jgi:hypothetical protein